MLSVDPSGNNLTTIKDFLGLATIIIIIIIIAALNNCLFE